MIVLTRINVPLALGSNSFTFHLGADLTSFPHLGLNLFFGGNDNTPGISARADENNPSFTADGGSTLNLKGDTSEPDANSLVYSGGGVDVTLTSYLVSTPDVYHTDRVSLFSDVPDGRFDTIGQFTLTVTPAALPSTPVPAAPVVVLIGAAVYGWGVRRACKEKG